MRLTFSMGMERNGAKRRRTGSAGVRLLWDRTGRHRGKNAKIQIILHRRRGPMPIRDGNSGSVVALFQLGLDLLNAIAQLGGALELQVVGRLAHLLAHLLEQVPLLIVREVFDDRVSNGRR